ncbi:MAG: hypothetical protein FK730_12775 [Asgard group archaeon]|nr:hypothetical protein [Asgard group archaeon]
MDKLKIYSLFIIFNIIIIPYLFCSSNQTNLITFNDLIITSDINIGYYGSVIFDKDLHIICATQAINKGNSLVHYVINDNFVKPMNFIVKDFTWKSKLTLSSSEKILYLAYKVSTWNETTQSFYEKYFCYYYDLQLKKGCTISWPIMTQSTSDIFTVNNFKKNALFLITNYINPSLIELIFINQNHNTTISSKISESDSLNLISLCSSENKNCTYVFFEKEKDSEYKLSQFNCSTYTWSTLANCSFLPSTSGYLIRSGRILYDDIIENFYFVCPKGQFENCEFSIFELNSTSSCFELLTTTQNSYSFLHPGTQIVFYTDNVYFDVYINNRIVNIIYRTIEAHSQLKKVIYSQYSLIDQKSWNHTELDLQENLIPFHSSFIYNLTSKSYSNSFIFGCEYDDSQYHHIGRSKSINSIGIYGNLFNYNIKPYLIHVMKTSYFWLAILGPTGFLLLSTSALFYFIKKYRKKKKIVGN